MNKNLDDINSEIINSAAVQYPGRRVVLGDGNMSSVVMLIGEAPGGDEEKQGRPFVGKAGKNLMDFLSAVGLKREELYLSNVVKIRPYKLSSKTGQRVNRPPSREEINFFISLLYDEIEAVKPEIIVTLGNVPLQAVLKDNKAQIGDYHGKLICLGDQKVFPLYHPAAVIYNRSLENIYYEDIEKLKGNINQGR